MKNMRKIGLGPTGLAKTKYTHTKTKQKSLPEKKKGKLKSRPQIMTYHQSLNFLKANIDTF